MTTQQGTARSGRPLRANGEIGVDLHMHSSFSDGVKTPAELCCMARKAGIEVLALTDHDTALGQADMQQAAQGMTLIPGVEVSTGNGGRVHVLGYGPKVLSAETAAFLASIRADRIIRAERVIEKLRENGVIIPDAMRDKLLQNPGVGRPHIARALVELGVVNTTKQAFDRYLIGGQCAYVPRHLPSTSEAVSTLASLGVIPVLAHPMEMRQEMPMVESFLMELKGLGLRGVECYHPSANPRQAQELEHIARRLGLLVTGGSDYHGDPTAAVHLGRLPAGWHSRTQDLQALLEAR